VITGATWTTSGKNGGALLFNGVDNLVTVSSTALNLNAGMTVEGWVFPTVLTNLRSVAVKEGATDLAYGLYANDATAKPEGVINVGAGPLSATATGTLPVNVWSHLAVTFDGSTQRLFLNGVEVASAAASGTLMQTSGAFRVGGNKLWGEWFGGSIDDVRVYSRALTATEIQADMNTAVDPPPPDTAAPTVAISTPVAGATVSGTVGVVANASDDIGVASVQLLLNGQNLGPSLTSSPYSVTWDTKNVANGTYTLTAMARDFAGNANVSSDVSVTVNNAPPPDTVAPTVAISSPLTGATVSGTVSVVANASDNIGVASVQLLLNGQNLGASLTASPYAVTWDTKNVVNGTYTLTAVARDLAGNTKVSNGVTVTVNNASPFIVGRYVQFTSADHLATLSDGRSTVSGYTLEVWLAGSNISMGAPYQTSNLGKPASTTTTISVDEQTFFAGLPKGQEFFVTITATGPGGSSRSGASNSFMMQ